MIRKYIYDSTRYFLRLNGVLQGHFIPLNIPFEKFNLFTSYVFEHKYSVFSCDKPWYSYISTHSIYLLLLNLPLHLSANSNNEKIDVFYFIGSMWHRECQEYQNKTKTQYERLCPKWYSIMKFNVRRDKQYWKLLFY